MDPTTTIRDDSDSGQDETMNSNQPKFSFELLRTLGGSDENFIQLKTSNCKNENHNPDIKWEPGMCKYNEGLLEQLSVKEIFHPLSIPSGTRFMTWDTPWAYGIYPNMKVVEILLDRFNKKYGENNLLTNKFEYNNKAYLFVITKMAIIAIYTTIISHPESEKFIVGKNLYITGFIDDKITRSRIIDTGRPKHHIKVPDELKIKSKLISANFNEVNKYFKPPEDTIDKLQSWIESCIYKQENGMTTMTLKFTKEEDNLLVNLLNGVTEFDKKHKTTVVDLYYKFKMLDSDKFKKLIPNMKTNICLTKNGQDISYTSSDILDLLSKLIIE